MSRRAAHISADPFVRVSHHSFRSFSSRWRVKWLVKLSLRMGTWFRWLPAVGEASVLGSLERCLGSMGLRGMLGLFPAGGCEAEPRGDDAAEPRDGVGLVMLRWEALRWLAGLLAMAPVIWMTLQTLRIPNTQSATGMLYVGVILTFLGELVALLLSEQSPFPV